VRDHLAADRVHPVADAIPSGCVAGAARSKASVEGTIKADAKGFELRLAGSWASLVAVARLLAAVVLGLAAVGSAPQLAHLLQALAQR
jgi:hypothetical protein